MSVRLDKARGALLAARDILEAATADTNGLMPLRDAEEFSRKLQVANTQAQVAMAEAVERIVQILEHHLPSQEPL